ncbi:photoreceptor cilium actin regulator-like [Paroedura picta]|uniref:photoreceptor cilium actin regulator-like n=1 Tax=Paroedura picta TaxID=143630 RepID=UPI00405742EE
MGCAPSHSVTAIQNAERRNKPLKKGIWPGDPESEGVSVHLKIKDSSSYVIDDLGQGVSQGKDCFLENTSDEDKNVNFRSSSDDPSLLEVYQEEKDMGILVSESEIAAFELTEPYQNVAENVKRKQTFCKPQKTVLECKNEKPTPKRGKKQKNRHGNQDNYCKPKDKSCATICKEEGKVDFPDLLVKAHQNTYAYLNPSLSTYKSILTIAHQATETQLILQQMVSFVLFRFDEINHLLEEIAKDGEHLLKKVDGNLSWPADKGNPKEQPDLLQQLLHYTVNKMQLLNGTVSSLTSEVLQESCCFLQSAASSLEEKLKAKQVFDERLLRTIKLLEASIAGSYRIHPDDSTLYSEDSGIGIDSESVKDLNLLDKQGVYANCDSCSFHQSLNETTGNGTPSAREQRWVCPSAYAKTGPHDCALQSHFNDVFYSPAHIKKVASSSKIAAGSVDTVLQHQSIGIRIPSNSAHSAVIHEEECEECESTEASSTTEDNDDNSLSEEERDSILEKGKIVITKRPTIVPTSKDINLRRSTKQIETPEKQKIISKMKDAISEKIKFVPAKPEKREWSEDENGRATQVQRPSTATRRPKTKVKQRRSRSAESLKSQAEDPTLLELQRTQKALNNKLEIFYTHNENKDTKCKFTSMNQKEKSRLQDDERVTHRSSTNKLKASLAKHFSILPNQDKVPLLRQDQNAISKKPDGRKYGKLVTTTRFSQEQTSTKENEPPGTQKLNSVACSPPRKSVKKLIETFSPPEGLVKPISLRSLGPIKCVQNFGLPNITSNLSLPRGLIPLNQKHRIAPIADRHCPVNPTQHAFDPTVEPVLPSGNGTNEEIDEDCIENLPLPPAEMLVGLSSDCAQDARTENSYSEIPNKPANMTEHCTTKKISQISQRMKASLFFMDLLPSKNLNSSNFIVNKTSKSTVDSKARKCSLELNSIHMSGTPLVSQEDYEVKEAADLYRQNHKIIPLQHSKESPEQDKSDTRNKEFRAPLALDQQQSSPDLVGKNEKTTDFVRRVSPGRSPPSSPPSERRFPSPPLHHRHIHPASSPVVHRQPSPPRSPKAGNPPTQRKMPSPPSQQKLPSPPKGRKQHSPPTHCKILSPPSHRRKPSPPPFSTTSSPSASPSRLPKGLQNSLDSGDEQQSASPKIVSNAQSIFCPATWSLFEAKPPLPRSSSTTDAILRGPPKISTQGDNSEAEQQRRMDLRVANPHSFVRRSFSDHKLRFPFPLPLFPSATSEPVLSQASMNEKPKKEGDPWSSTCFSDLCIVGEGLQKDFGNWKD